MTPIRPELTPALQQYAARVEGVLERALAPVPGAPDRLLAAVRALELPPGEGYAWCAGEARAMATVRRILVDEKGHDKHAIRAAAYWKQGVTAHHENLESD